VNQKAQALKQYFGYDAFRDGQEELIDCILDGQDCLGVMPTGAGKSICFQVPSLLFSGITLVISPLISLMKDQVNALTQAGVRAAFINSSLSDRQYFKAIANARNGAYKIIYVAPERLESPDFLEFAKNADISMLTVDEAHCISQWGQDFRPSYLRIPDFLQQLPKRPVVSAFTATATLQVRDDIVKHLQLKEPNVLITGFDRKNLFFKVDKPDNKKTALLSFLRDKKDKSGIVYCATRKAVEQVSQVLMEKGYAAAPYHAGLTDVERRNNQDDFLYDRVQIMVATNAFGMGIDKSNVNFVVHYHMPKNIESYYQEAGRAGRDGEAADCLLLYNGQDVFTQLYLIDNAVDEVERDEVLKELDRKRLKEMSLYCQTYECLRGYVLRYFGEMAPENCGNCHNCLSEFQQMDVTVEAQKILSCVIKAGERYGVNTIIDTLRGSKGEKIMRFRLNELSTYNISTMSEKNLRDIINHLVMHGFLYVTDDKFPILKRGKRAAEVLQRDAFIEMKIEINTRSLKVDAVETRVPINKALFDMLKELRLMIAATQKVPAFVIFPDAALMDMCARLPKNDEEFLQVSGVGEMKLARYGKQFMDAIANFVESDVLFSNSEPGPDMSKVYMPQFSDIEFSDIPITASAVADKLSTILMANGAGKTTGRKLNDLLVENGYLQSVTDRQGRTYKTPTEKGEQVGITSEERVYQGKTSLINLFSRDAQEMIVGLF